MREMRRRGISFIVRSIAVAGLAGDTAVVAAEGDIAVEVAQRTVAWVADDKFVAGAVEQFVELELEP